MTEETYLPKETYYKNIKKFEFDGKQVEVNENDHGLVGLNDLNHLAESVKAGETEIVPKSVLLIDFKTLQKVPDNQDYTFQNFPNLGVHRIAGYLQHYGVPVTIVRFSELQQDPEKFYQLIGSHDIIGVSNLTNQIEDAYALCRDIKAQFGDNKLVLGGGEHYLAYDEILADPETNGIDACCIGQGELPMLSLALGKPVEEVGSLAYRAESDQTQISIVKNQRFERLIDGAGHAEQDTLGILQTREASPFSEEEVSSPAPFNELNQLPGDFQFDGTFVTSTGSGCEHACKFCPSFKFFGHKFKSNIGVGEQEILAFKKAFPEKEEVFLTFADTMINPSVEHLGAITEFMRKTNSEPGPKISWFGYMSAPKLEKDETVEEWRGKWDAILSDMAEAGCIMTGVGVEEVIYDRNKFYGKGQDIDTASDFISLAGRHMLVRPLLILGAPEHFAIDRDKALKDKEDLDAKYESDHDLIKGEILGFMKSHPQALYRFSIWTLMNGTDDYYKYKECIDGDVADPSVLKNFDQMHSTIDPEKMYQWLEKDTEKEIPDEKRWVKDKEVWFRLMEEIMEEYLNCDEYLNYLETLRDKVTEGKKGLLYEIAIKFRNNSIAQIESNRAKR
jgi:radical SAM superfamily enzyme YgiQ (UPF0313 family)